jgi:hypothetical protein
MVHSVTSPQSEKKRAGCPMNIDNYLYAPPRMEESHEAGYFPWLRTRSHFSGLRPSYPRVIRRSGSAVFARRSCLSVIPWGADAP